MSLLRTVGIAGVLLPVLLSGAFVLGRRGRAPTAHAHAKESPALPGVADLSTQVQALRGEVATLRAAALASVSANVAPATDRSPNESASAAPAAMPATLDDVRTDIAARFETESEDRRFESSFVPEAARLFGSGAVPGSSFVSASCRSTMCKVKVRHDDLDAQRALSEVVVLKPPFDQSQILYVYDKGDPPETTLYVGRAGASIVHDAFVSP